MTKPIEINVSWGSRLATLKECSESFIIFIERLKRFDSRLGIWYEGANSRKKAIQNEVIFEYDCIKKKFCKSCS